MVGVPLIASHMEANGVLCLVVGQANGDHGKQVRELLAILLVVGNVELDFGSSGHRLIQFLNGVAMVVE